MLAQSTMACRRRAAARRRGSAPAPTGGESEQRRQRWSRPATHGPQLEVLKDPCLPTFSPAASYAVGANPQAIVSGYFNHDTVLDLAVANYGGGSVSVL